MLSIFDFYLPNLRCNPLFVKTLLVELLLLILIQFLIKPGPILRAVTVRNLILGAMSQTFIHQVPRHLFLEKLLSLDGDLSCLLNVADRHICLFLQAFHRVLSFLHLPNRSCLLSDYILELIWQCFEHTFRSSS